MVKMLLLLFIDFLDQKLRIKTSDKTLEAVQNNEQNKNNDSGDK